MKVTFWGTRGSIAAAGPHTARYGGNTACVEINTERDETLFVLDAGSGIVRLTEQLDVELSRVDLLLTHLHMDHVQGLGFFAPLYNPAAEVHIWGPPSTTRNLHERLSRYMAPPLFPVRLRDLQCQLTLHDVPIGGFEVGGFEIQADLVCHPGATVGYRVQKDGRTLAYLPDHEPALGSASLSAEHSWISGMALAAGADVLIHDAQYDDQEYSSRIGWGHSTISDALEFATTAGAGTLVPFHYDPTHSDGELDRLFASAVKGTNLPFDVKPAKEGDVIDV